MIRTDSIEESLKDQINLKDNEELDITVSKREKQKLPPFVLMGSGEPSKTYSSDDVVDALAILSELSPHQLKIVFYFKNEIVRQQIIAHHTNNIDKDAHTVFIPKSTADKVAVEIRKLLSQNKNGKILVEKQVVKKIKNGVYMMNPFFIIPSQGFNEILKKWNAI
jgi:hypothetical protein